VLPLAKARQYNCRTNGENTTDNRSQEGSSMPSLTVSVPHALDRQEATARLKERFESAKGTFGDDVNDLVAEWNGNVLSFAFSAFGIKVSGTATSGESEVVVDAKLPMAAMLFRGKIEQQIREELEKILA